MAKASANINGIREFFSECFYFYNFFYQIAIFWMVQDRIPFEIVSPRMGLP